MMWPHRPNFCVARSYNRGYTEHLFVSSFNLKSPRKFISLLCILRLVYVHDHDNAVSNSVLLTSLNRWLRSVYSLFTRTHRGGVSYLRETKRNAFLLLFFCFHKSSPTSPPYGRSQMPTQLPRKMTKRVSESTACCCCRVHDRVCSISILNFVSWPTWTSRLCCPFFFFFFSFAGRPSRLVLCPLLTPRAGRSWC